MASASPEPPRQSSIDVILVLRQMDAAFLAQRQSNTLIEDFAVVPLCSEAPQALPTAAGPPSPVPAPVPSPPEMGIAGPTTDSLSPSPSPLPPTPAPYKSSTETCLQQQQQQQPSSAAQRSPQPCPGLATSSPPAPAFVVLVQGQHLALDASAAGPLYKFCSSLLTRHLQGARTSTRAPLAVAQNLKTAGPGGAGAAAPPLALSFTRALVLINADHGTAWRARKQVLASSETQQGETRASEGGSTAALPALHCTPSGTQRRSSSKSNTISAACKEESLRRMELEEELHLTQLVLSSNPKSTDAWVHRRWVLLRLREQWGGVQAHRWKQQLLEESQLVQTLVESKPQSYRAWAHRCWTVQHWSTQEEVQLELARVQPWTSRNVEDNCSLHYRQTLLAHLVHLTRTQWSSHSQGALGSSSCCSSEVKGVLCLSSPEECWSNDAQRDSVDSVGSTKDAEVAPGYLQLPQQEHFTAGRGEEEEILLRQLDTILEEEWEWLIGLLHRYPARESLWTHRRRLLHLWLTAITPLRWLHAQLLPQPSPSGEGCGSLRVAATERREGEHLESAGAFKVVLRELQTYVTGDGREGGTVPTTSASDLPKADCPAYLPAPHLSLASAAPPVPRAWLCWAHREALEKWKLLQLQREGTVGKPLFAKPTSVGMKQGEETVQAAVLEVSFALWLLLLLARLMAHVPESPGPSNAHAALGKRISWTATEVKAQAQAFLGFLKDLAPWKQPLWAGLEEVLAG